MFSLLICGIVVSATIHMGQGKYVFHAEIQRHTLQHKQVATFEDAEKHCKSEGATLASPTSAEMLTYMMSVISVNNHDIPYFIGTKAKRNVELQFLTEEGMELEDVPVAVDLIEQLDSRKGDCLCMDRHSIRVVPCWSRLPYICYKNVTKTAVPTTEVSETTASTEPTLVDRLPGIECARNEYICGSGECIDLLNLCNGVADCSNGEDESLYCGVS